VSPRSRCLKPGRIWLSSTSDLARENSLVALDSNLSWRSGVTPSLYLVGSATAWFAGCTPTALYAWPAPGRGQPRRPGSRNTLRDAPSQSGRSNRRPRNAVIAGLPGRGYVDFQPAHNIFRNRHVMDYHSTRQTGAARTGPFKPLGMSRWSTLAIVAVLAATASV